MPGIAEIRIPSEGALARITTIDPGRWTALMEGAYKDTQTMQGHPQTRRHPHCYASASSCPVSSAASWLQGESLPRKQAAP